MCIKEEIFRDFVQKLRKEKEFSDEIINKIKELWEHEKITSQEEILKLISGDHSDDIKN
ncbi:MAG: hypothetical protein K9W46_12215 [Candidatus Heimdallarchaeum endolithica]|uniref:Uncharacterized protein n=1 Tax=Candidatus Heimdallarchaeum endolithica TaxID=2876572 RepID=A0A9Y1BQF1_9ARCH|nr:MAG: hypothetical protein K9W46_12215 [Candidatus Heimdallarchaeum endolithica]